MIYCKRCRKHVTFCYRWSDVGWEKVCDYCNRPVHWFAKPKEEKPCNSK